MRYKKYVPPHSCEHPSRPACLAEMDRLRRELASLDAQNQACRQVRAHFEHELQAFKTVFENSPVPLVWFDRDGRFLRANKAGFLCYLRESLPPDYSIFSEPLLIVLGITDLFKRVLAGETVRTPRYHFNPSRISANAPDQEYLLETVMVPVMDRGGYVSSVIVQHCDLTPVQQAEQEMQRLRGMLASLVP